MAGWGGAAVAGLGPVPGSMLAEGTILMADVYPSHAGIGGINTQELALPAFAEERFAVAERAATLGGVEKNLAGTPAGWFALALVVLLILAWLYR